MNANVALELQYKGLTHDLPLQQLTHSVGYTHMLCINQLRLFRVPAGILEGQRFLR